MDVTTLNVEQRKAIAVLAFQMMVADHSAVPAEHARVDWLEQELQVAGQIEPAQYYVEPAADLFPDRASQQLVIGELFLVALADGHRHPNENVLLQRLSDAFGLSGQTMTDLLAWASLPQAERPPLSASVSPVIER